MTIPEMVLVPACASAGGGARRIDIPMAMRTNRPASITLSLALTVRTDDSERLQLEWLFEAGRSNGKEWKP
jgi:hypothetical protein